jgi:hypothetical protein
VVVAGRRHNLISYGVKERVLSLWNLVRLQILTATRNAVKSTAKLLIIVALTIIKKSEGLNWLLGVKVQTERILAKDR